MSMKDSSVHETCLINIEEFFMDRLVDLVNNNQIDDADAIHNEFVVEDPDSEEWLFISDMTNV